MAGIPPGLAKFIAQKAAGGNSGPSGLQNAAAQRLASKREPKGKNLKKKKATVPMVPDNDMDGE